MSREPKFKPKPGQMDYTNARWAPVINVVVQRPDGKILAVKRSKEISLYPGLWNGIGGFLDDKKSLDEKVREELREETGISASAIKKVTLGAIFDVDDRRYRKTFVMHPVLVSLRSAVPIMLDWEASAYKWVAVDEARALDCVPVFHLVLDALFGPISSCGKLAQPPRHKKLPPLPKAAHSLKLGVYEHYKGNRYQVLGIAFHSETLEEMVIYRARYGPRATFVRPLMMFLESVMRDGRRVPRFRHVNKRRRD